MVESMFLHEHLLLRKQLAIHAVDDLVEYCSIVTWSIECSPS